MVSYTRSLLVTEIFIDGTDEFIELSTDIWESFSGVVYLSWAKSSPVPLSIAIGSGESIVFSDKDVLFRSDIRVWSWYGWSFTDTAPIDRQLLNASGIVLDAVAIATGVVVDINNTQSSLTRIGTGRSITTASWSIDMIEGYYGSPTYRWQRLVDVLAQTDATTEIVCTGDPSWRITEVFVWSEEMSAFLELQAQEMITDPMIVFTGDLLSGLILSASGQRYPGDELLMSWWSTGVISADIDMLVTTEYQLGTGILSISGQSGQVLDSVSVSHVISWSQNFGGQGCWRDFDTIWLSTPGYPETVSYYFTPIITTEPPQCPVPPSDPTLTLDGVWPAPPTGLDETIVLTLHTDEMIDLDQYYILKNGWSKRYLYGPTITSGSVILTGNFALSNTADTCVELRNDDILLDYLCYTADHAADGIRIGSGPVPRSTDDYTIDTGTDTGSMFSGSVSIDTIVYDPPWSDTGAEQITITNYSNQTFEPEDLRILIGEAQTKRYIRETITSGATVTATATFLLSNSTSTCVELHHDSGLLDTYCYTVAKTSVTVVHNDHDSSDRAADIMITDLVYDPPWSDTDRESITLLLADDESSVDLDEYRLWVGTVRKKLDGTLRPWEPLTITKTRWFVNSRASCATLAYRDKPIDSRCRAPGDPQTVTTTGSVDNEGEMIAIWSLSILDIVYDPDGNDTGREQIHLAYTGMHTLDLVDVHLLINDRKKLIEWTIASGDSHWFIDTFRFPNTKATCVQLRAFEVMWDEYCYDPTEKEEVDEKDEVDEVVWSIWQIIAVYPNPPGADGEGEWVRAMIDTTQYDGQRSLQIGDRTTRTEPSFDPLTQTLRRQGALSLPNRVGCLRLLYTDQLVDTFCYFFTDDDQTIDTDQEERHDLSTDAVSLLNRLTVTTQGSGSDKQFCLRTDGVSLVCKDAPTSRSTTTPPERFYRDYIWSLHAYLARNWSPIYYETDVAQHVKLYDAMRDAFRAGDESVMIHHVAYPLDTPMEDLRVAQQQTSYYDIFIDSVVRPLANGIQE